MSRVAAGLADASFFDALFAAKDDIVFEMLDNGLQAQAAHTVNLIDSCARHEAMASILGLQPVDGSDSSRLFAMLPQQCVLTS